MLIAAAGLCLLAGCPTAGFSTYDDPAHIPLGPQANEAMSFADTVKPVEHSTYFPVTLLSYKLDRVLFVGWMPRLLGSYAPGVRFMTLLYHAGAALLLWRILLRLKLSRGQALFIACVFAVHPLACETVCWVSERKNALAALFGFASLWAWLRYEGTVWRLPAVAALYALALLGKPSALGLLPVFLVLELFGGAKGLTGEGPMNWRPSKHWLPSLGRLLPLGLLSAACVAVNVAGHKRTLLPPPGGSVFTALLTDLEILSRYLLNLLAPMDLSAAYFVKPVASLADPRVAGYGLLLAAIAGVTIWAARNRRRAVFGWLWFVGALGPSLNLIALTSLMQDRYLYLSTPGFLLVLVEVAAGLEARLGAFTGRAFRLAAPVYVVALAALASVQGTNWNSAFYVFKDAVEKQPQSSFAHYGMGIVYGQAWHMASKNPASDPQQVQEFHRQWIAHWQAAVDGPDADRQLDYAIMANRVGEELNKAGDAAGAEKYWLLAAYPPAHLPDQPAPRARALVNLVTLRLAQKRPAEAYEYAQAAVAIRRRDTTCIARARAALALAEEKRPTGDEAAVQRLAAEARQDLESIAEQSRTRPEVKKILEHPLLKP